MGRCSVDQRSPWAIAIAAAIAIVACGGRDEGPHGSGQSSATGGIASITAAATEADDGDDGHADETGDKLDVGMDETGGVGPGDCNSGGGGGMMGGNEFSIIWIGNSPAGTVSKIDTKTGLELARYYSSPLQDTGDPSRTSVNLQGDVAVSNRSGSVTKIASELERCVDKNGNGTIETSSGPTDVLAWGQDECVLWHRELFDVQGDNTKGPRPTAWDAGAGGNPCVPDDDRLWVGWFEREQNQGHFQRLAGADGAVLDDVIVNPWDSPNGTYGPYGGGVDGDGNMWVSGLWGPLVRIDHETVEWQRWDVPVETMPYGIAIDANGHPWTAGLAGDILHFDPTTQQFESFFVPGQVLRGVAIDRESRLWAAANQPCGLVEFDIVAKTFINMAVPLPSCGTPVGVSIDVDGFVWSPDQGASLAYKIDPITYAATNTPNLVQPYTYSDMTGAGLGLVTNPPQG